MLERHLRAAKYPMRKFPLSQPPLGLHWGVGIEDSFLFLGNSPAIVDLPARRISLDPRKSDTGYGEILLEAEMLDDAYYFGMIELFNLTGDNPSTSTTSSTAQPCLQLPAKQWIPCSMRTVTQVTHAL